MRSSLDPLSDRRLKDLGLTARQSEIVRELVRGASAREVGERLVISTNTARKHIANIYATLGVNSRAAAIAKLLG